MRTLPLLLAALFFMFINTSCVVMKKKYDEEVATRIKTQKDNERLNKEVAKLKKELADLQAQHAKLNTQKDSLEHASQSNIQSLSSKLDKLNKELQSKEQLLNQKETELKEKERLLKEKERIVQELSSMLNNQKQLIEDLQKSIKDALVAFDGEDLQVEIKNGKVYVSVSEKLLFKSGSTSVDAKGVEVIKNLAQVLKSKNDIDIQVEGHTDNVPIKTSVFKDNWDLSVLRATSILRILVDNGVDPKRVLPSGRGEFYPVVENDTKEGKARNRRTEIILAPKLDKLFEMINNSSLQTGN